MVGLAFHSVRVPHKSQEPVSRSKCPVYTLTAIIRRITPCQCEMRSKPHSLVVYADKAGGRKAIWTKIELIARLHNGTDGFAVFPSEILKAKPHSFDVTTKSRTRPMIKD